MRTNKEQNVLRGKFYFQPAPGPGGRDWDHVVLGDELTGIFWGCVKCRATEAGGNMAAQAGRKRVGNGAKHDFNHDETLILLTAPVPEAGL